jgi:hypothetical protein
VKNSILGYGKILVLVGAITNLVGMKNLLLLSIFGITGYFAYSHWFASEPPPPPPPPPPVAEKVSLGIRKSVRMLFEEWKKRELSPHVQSATAITPERELAEIRNALFSSGAYSEQAFMATITSALLELGVSQAEVSEVASGVVSLRSEQADKADKQSRRDFGR